MIPAYSQRQYYTTNGINRITETDMLDKIVQMTVKMNSKGGDSTFVSLTVEEKFLVEDSLISLVTIHLSDKRPAHLINMAPLSDFKGKLFPEFNLATLKGDSLNSESLYGKPTLINFWFTRCAPCIDEMPVLNEIAESYGDRFNFIAITYEKRDAVEKFLDKHDFNFTHLVSARNFIDTLGLQSYPMNLFIDRNGVLKVVKGGIPYEEPEDGVLSMGAGDEVIKIMEKLLGE
jgi:thiol-disulfide isomerase/thioredoxin